MTTTKTPDAVAVVEPIVEHLQQAWNSGDGMGFADPFAETESGGSRPGLLLLDDGTEDPTVREHRGALIAAAGAHDIRHQTIAATEGPGTARYAALLTTGRYAATYLGVGLGRTSPDQT